ncbi:hypothetical protein BDN70DRAFT_904456 [Pholiota conissans]|uniref:Peptidase M48 domain-containing protein n=1 Tax=Pholiota conissans TaxID=109636 RepID=A0A9P5Z8F5_9AGAR|nr:hypothetical protein BDN70DRAFT_904456 [Pholiota conissans]
MFRATASNLGRVSQLAQKGSHIKPNSRPFSSSLRNQAYVRFSTPGNRGQPQRPRNTLDWRTWDRRVKFLVGTGVLGSAYYISHQEQVPETGRWRFMNTSPEFEAQAKLLHELGPKTLPLNHPITRHVRRVATRVLHASNLGILSGEKIPTVLSPFGIHEGESWNPDAQFGAAANPGPVYGPTKEWNVLVVNDMKTINAMAIPGTIIVFTGILPICQDEEGLAAVLSHVARHTAERLSGQTIRMIVVGLLSFVLGIDVNITNTFQTLMMELPNSRTQEREADLIGIRLMSRACYDPAAAPQVFGRLARLESKIAAKMGLDFFRTHPSSESRVKLLEEALPEAYAILAANPECEHVREQIESFKASARAISPDEHGDWVFA